MKLFQRFMREESGLETVEYAVAMALVIGVFAAGWALLKPSIDKAFTDTKDNMVPPT